MSRQTANTAPSLSESQRMLLTLAVDNGGELRHDLETPLKGGPRLKVTQALEARGLIKPARAGYRVTKAGFDVLGRSAPKADVKTEAREAATKAPVSRENSKQAQVIALLKREQGATIAQICQATGWQPHTVRGTFAGTFKKRLGLALTSDKTAGGERVYRIE